MAAGPQLNEVIRRLTDTLELEKRLLVEARYSELGNLAKLKTQLSDVLDRLLLEQSNAKQISVYRKPILKLAKTAQENEKMLKAAKAGATFAHARIHDIIGRQRNVGVYAESGDKLLVPDAGITRTKLA